MPTEFETDILAGITEIMAEFGISVVFYVETDGNFDPAVGSHSSEPISIAVTGSPVVPAKTTIDDPALKREVDGLMYVEAAEFTGTIPDVGDHVVVNSERWKIIGKDEMRPGVSIAAYEFWLVR